MSDLPDEFHIPNPYNLPVHDQGNKSSCSSHAFATIIEYKLSNQLKERVLADADDLWEKQKKFGTAIEGKGDIMEGPMIICSQYSLKIATDSGRKGLYFLGRGIVWD